MYSSAHQSPLQNPLLIQNEICALSKKLSMEFNIKYFHFVGSGQEYYDSETISPGKDQAFWLLMIVIQ